MKHLVDLTAISAAEIHALLDRAEQLATETAPARSLAGRTVANVFFEPSTLTRVSFELAARKLGAYVISLDMQNSSFAKGETLTDTYRALLSMGTDAFVLRTSEAGLPTALSRKIGDDVAIINAGDAHMAHPTQGLIDALTIRQHKGHFADLSVAIVGDAAHSRVARSTLRVLDILGCQDMRIVAPLPWQPVPHEIPKAVLTEDIRLGVQGCDVVIVLRIQNERLGSGERLNPHAYVERFCVDERSLAYARNDAIVMHPGPINRGVEISTAVADGPQSVIQKQVRNGIGVRAAVFDAIARARGWYNP